MSDEKPKETRFGTFWGDSYRWPDDGPEFWDAYYRDIGHPNADWDAPHWVEMRSRLGRRHYFDILKGNLAIAWFVFLLILMVEIVSRGLFDWSPTMVLLEYLADSRTQ